MRDALVTTLVTVVFYPFFIRSMKTAAERKRFEALMAENP